MKQEEKPSNNQNLINSSRFTFAQRVKLNVNFSQPTIQPLFQPPREPNYDHLREEVNAYGLSILDDLGFPLEDVEWNPDIDKIRGVGWDQMIDREMQGLSYMDREEGEILDSADILL